MTTRTGQTEAEQTIKRLEAPQRTCACVSSDATECTSIRYHQDRETVIANDDQCQCGCHYSEEDEEDYFFHLGE